jgi:TRAP-type C4-dicarboxylate transport system substrate-binding protein
MKKFLGFLSILILFTLNNTALGTEKVYLMRIMHAYPTNCQHHYNLEEFQRLVNEELGGRVEVQLFPNGQLGSIEREVGMVQSGAVEGAYAINGTMEQVTLVEAIYTLPFFWESQPDDPAEYWEATKYDGPIESFLREKQKEVGIYRLGSINTQNGQFIAANNRRPVKKPEDMKGLKLRHSGGMVATQTLELLGAIPITMSGGDVPVALSQGVIDGMQSAILHYHDSRWHTKYATVSYIKCYSLPLIVNLEWWESLPQGIQDTIQNSIIPKLQEYANKAVTNGEHEALKTMQEAPYDVEVTVIPTNEIMEVWADYNSMREEGMKLFLSKTGEDGMYLVKEALKIKERLGHKVPEIPELK